MLLHAKNKSNDDIFSEIITITPELAQNYLDNQIKNRPLSESRVSKYCADIINNKWLFTHQGIAFDNNNKLIDGQHRLAAIIKANIPVKMVVTFNIDPTTFIVFDTGGNRKVSDIIALEGYSPRVARIVASAIAYCISYELGYLPTKNVPKSLGNTNTAVLNYFEENIDIVDSAEYIIGFPRRDALIPDSASCFVHYEVSKKYDRDTSDEFINFLLTGDNLPAMSIIAELRRQLMASRMGNHKLRSSIVIARTIAAFNYWNSGVELRDPRQALMKVKVGNTVQIIK